MSPRFPSQFVAALALTACCTSCLAQNYDAVAYKSLAEILSSLTSEPIVFLQPGLFIDPTYDYTSPEEKLALSVRFNTLVKPSLMFSPTTRMLGELYVNVLTNALWADVPLISAQRQNLKASGALLFGTTEATPTVGYQRYLDLKKIYDDIESRYEATPPDQIDPELQNARDQAETDLQLKGHKTLYEGAEATFSSLKNQASYQWRDIDLKAVKSAIPASAISDHVLLSNPSPNVQYFDSIQWVEMKITDDQLRNIKSAPVFGDSIDDIVHSWWQQSNDKANQKSKCSPHFSDQPTEIHFSAAKLILTRDWLDLTVFSSRAWKWKNGAPKISDGRLNNNSGASPLYLSSILVVKDLIISGAGITECLDMIRNAIRAKQNVSFGPFAIADIAEGPNSLYLPPMISNLSVRVPYIQLIGYGVSAFPNAPNPNADFLWPQNQ